MKKFWIVSAAAFAISLTAFASPEFTSRLNSELSQLLHGYNNNITQAKLEFRNVTKNDAHVLFADLSGFFQKVGPSDTASLTIDSLRYTANLGTQNAPLTEVSASLGLNATKLVGQETINDLVPQIPELVASIIANQAGKFQEALLVESKLDRTEQDSAGNYTFVAGTVALRVDFTKLPQDAKKEDVPVTSINLNFAFNPSVGISVVANAQSNLEYKGFRADQMGLKEYFELLLSRDSNTLEKLNKLLVQLDDFAKRITGIED